MKIYCYFLLSSKILPVLKELATNIAIYTCTAGLVKFSL